MPSKLLILMMLIATTGCLTGSQQINIPEKTTRTFALYNATSSNQAEGTQISKKGKDTLFVFNGQKYVFQDQLGHSGWIKINAANLTIGIYTITATKNDITVAGGGAQITVAHEKWDLNKPVLISGDSMSQ